MVLVVPTLGDGSSQGHIAIMRDAYMPAGNTPGVSDLAGFPM